MKNIIDKGYALVVPTNAKTNEVWYIPHHGVYHPKSLEKL